MDPVTAPSPRRPVGARDAGFEFAPVIAGSAVMRHTIQTAHRVAGTPVRALMLFGEAGAGKDLLARCIHNAGAGASDPFIAINCSSIPSAMLETELFGSDPAHRDAPRRAGALELAGRGTVYLDEVGELPLALQDRLARSLEEYGVPRLGSAASNEVPVHCRVIAATRSRLEDAVSAGTFRDDLAARLAVLRIELPPLRERDDDVRLIADHFLSQNQRIRGESRRQIGLDALAVLRAHRWPGNVRELKHVIDRAAIVASGPVIGAEHLMINQQRAGASALHGTVSFGDIRIPGEGKRLRDIEREALELTLRLTENNQSAAARILCISRPTLARKLKAYRMRDAQAK
jgi:DNA-binding NtrC family response regulator